MLHYLAFGKAMWASHLWDVREEPPLPADIDAILARPCPFLKGKKISETHMLTLVPARVNGAPLTLKLIGELVKTPRTENVAQCCPLSCGEYQDPAAPKAHWVLMTRQILEGTRGKSYEEQKTVVAQCAAVAKVPYEIPYVLDATVSILAEYVRSGICLYGREPWTWTRCQDKFSDSVRLVVGGFAKPSPTVSAGLGIRGYPDNETVGVACVRHLDS